MNYIDLDEETSTKYSSLDPKSSSSTFSVKNNQYVVTDGTTFSYYLMKVEDEETTSPIFRFNKTPPVLLEGIAIIRRKLYAVTIDDLMRGVIRKSREIKLEGKENARTSTDAENLSGSSTELHHAVQPRTVNIETSDVKSGGETVQLTDESGIMPFDTLEITEASNSFEPEQIGALLDLVFKEEGKSWDDEWEIAEV